MFRKSVDGAYRNFSREYGDTIEAVFDPVLYFLVWFEKLLQNSPWPLIILAILILVYIGSRSIYLTIGSLIALLLIGYFGMWEDTMSTLAIILVATFLCIAIGIPLGIAMARSNKVQAAIVPVLDVMQTIPSFVYLLSLIHI